MKYNADGSLTIYLQADNPGKDKEATGCPRLGGHSSSTWAPTLRARR